MRIWATCLLRFAVVPYQSKHQFLVVKVVINVFPQLRWFTHYSCVEGPVQSFHSWITGKKHRVILFPRIVFPKAVSRIPKSIVSKQISVLFATKQLRLVSVMGVSRTITFINGASTPWHKYISNFQMTPTPPPIPKSLRLWNNNITHNLKE